MTTSLPTRPPALVQEAYDNVCNCRGVDNGRKHDLLTEIIACGANNACAERAHATHCRDLKRKGPEPPDLLPDEGLGVLVDEIVFKKRMHDAFGMSYDKFEKKMSDFLTYHEKRAQGTNPTEDERLAAMSFMRAKVPARTDGTVWFFRHPTRDRNPFNGVANEWLAHRLGLDLTRWGPRGLTFSFYRAHVDNIHLPTFCDVTWQYLRLWDWRGKTRPLPGSPAGMDGLEEVVAEPPEIGWHNPPVVSLAIRHP